MSPAVGRSRLPEAREWPALGPAEVHIWQLSLRRSPDELEGLHGLLDADERARVARYRLEADRYEALAARGLLRWVLGGYLRQDPATLRFRSGANGKPWLVDSGVQFNLSHTRGLALLAVAIDGAVGVDVERVHAVPDYQDLAHHFFSDAERRVLAGCSRAEAELGFFRCWTRKEAYLKARGDGLAIPLAAFDVPLGTTEEPCPVISREPAPEARGWYVRDVSMEPRPGAAVAAAVALRRPRWQIRPVTWLLTPDGARGVGVASGARDSGSMSAFTAWASPEP
jgi:4'-phosphopantetheinyl transferase